MKGISNILPSFTRTVLCVLLKLVPLEILQKNLGNFCRIL